MNVSEPSVAALCKRLIGMPSVTSAGTRRIAEFCASEILAPHGIEARLIASPYEGPEQVNLLAFVTGADRGATPLVFNTHLDTVPPGELAQWTECGGKPFDAMIKGDRIYGLGAADTKLDFVAKAVALAQCGKPRRDTWLVGSFGEEHGLIGAKELVASGLLPKNAIALVGEPSHLKVITAHKGLMAFELTIQFRPIVANRKYHASKIVIAGKAAHSSTPALGENAIAKALATLGARPRVHLVSLDGGDAVNKVPARCEIVVAADHDDDLEGIAAEKTGLVSELIPPAAGAMLDQFIRVLTDFADATGPAEMDYAAPTLTANAGVVRTRGNQLVLDFELRPPPSLALEAVRDGIDRMVQRLRGHYPELTVRLAEKRANPGFRSPAESEAVEIAMGALADAQLPLETGVKAGCTEAGIYAAAGLQPIVFGPGPSTGVIHAPNEYNLLSEVEAAIRFYRAVLG